MQDFNKECAASSDKGSEPVVLCSKMVRIAAAFLKETDSEGYEMLCEGLAKANPDSIAFINEHLLKGRTDDAEQADWDSSSGIGWRSHPDAVRSSSPGPRRVRGDGASE